MEELSMSPEPMFKGAKPGFYDKHFVSLTKIRHKTPPFVGMKKGIFYDPIRRNYLPVN